MSAYCENGNCEEALAVEHRGRAGLWISPALFAAALWLVSCGERTQDMDLRMFEAATAQEEELIRGRETYMVYCVGCHGPQGDGKGPAAEFLSPRPRDFTKGTFKYAAVAAGELVRDDDLIRALNHGLPGSSMPRWNLLDETAKKSLVAYIKTFSSRFANERPGQPLPIAPDPFGDPVSESEALARGKTVYHGLAGCYNCHPAYATHDEIRTAAATMGSAVPEAFSDSLYREKPKVSDVWGDTTRPPDFTRRRLSNGNTVDDLYRVIQAGVGGTAMPTWYGVLEPRDIWAMAHYVRYMNLMRGAPAGDSLRQSYGIR